ncbi:MAG: hypothetical protein WBL21_11745 [Salinimicrobium sp.]
MDFQFFGFYLEGSGVTVVNKTCPKKPQLNKTSEELSTAAVGRVLQVDFLCHTFFDHQVAEWVPTLPEDNFRKYQYQTPEIFPTHLEKLYPPPKV